MTYENILGTLKKWWQAPSIELLEFVLPFSESQETGLYDMVISYGIIKKKLITFLNSRGYNYDVIKEVCEKLIKEENL